jgi:hypothetical protein
VSAFAITICLFMALRMVPAGFAGHNYLKAGGGLALMLVPAFFARFAYGLKQFQLRDGRLLVNDLFRRETVLLSEIISVRRKSAFVYEIEDASGKKSQTIYFWLNEKNFKGICVDLGK